MKKPQLILAGSGLVLAVLLLVFGKFVPEKASVSSNDAAASAQGPMAQTPAASIDTILFYAKKELPTGQLIAL
ncbi:MAG: hypothetical protein ACO3AY_01725 [Chitinophagaceae bacterium]